MLSVVGVETAILTIARFSLFFGCRKYLLRILYSNLATLSTESSSDPVSRSSSPTPGLQDASIELETLPPPTTQTPRSTRIVLADPTYLHTSISREIFSWCFAESCMLFLLLMLQGWEYFSPRSRLLNWRFSLLFLVCCILVVIPLAFSLLLSLATTTSSPSSSRNRHFISLRSIFALASIGLYLLALSYVPVPSSLKASGTFSTYFSRLIVIGTVILGMLSGFGAISSSWRFFPTSEPQVVPSERDLDTAHYALTSVRYDIQQRREEAARREGTPSDGSLLSRFGSAFYGGGAVEQELQGLNALEYQMSQKLETLRERHEGAKFGRTLKGKIFNALDRLIAIYCVTRIVSSVYNVVFLPAHRTSPSRTYPDLFTNLLFFLYTHIWSAQPTAHSEYEKLAAVARQISLLLVGMIIFTSLRVVLRGVTRALRITSRNMSISLLLLLLAQIMAIYLLSTLVQMRSSFPPSSSPEEEMEDLFSTIPAYEVFGSLFDWTFLLAAGGSSLARWAIEKFS